MRRSRQRATAERHFAQQLDIPILDAAGRLTCAGGVCDVERLLAEESHPGQRQILAHRRQPPRLDVVTVAHNRARLVRVGRDAPRANAARRRFAVAVSALAQILADAFVNSVLLWESLRVASVLSGRRLAYPK